jgi:hypothetical protein
MTHDEVAIKDDEHGVRCLKVAPARYVLRLTPDFEVYLRSRPCWFHRTMQRLAFGFRWEKLPEAGR